MRSIVMSVHEMYANLHIPLHIKSFFGINLNKYHWYFFGKKSFRDKIGWE